MNKKGFTMVELLVVLVVLGLLAIIVVPTIQGVLKKSKDKINSINMNQLKDAGKLVGEEILFCELNDNTKAIVKIKNDNCEKDENGYCKDADCIMMQEVLYGDGITLNVSDLKEKKYLSDPNNLCKGKIIITSNQSNYKVSVVTEDADCSSK